jgi:hypothetical protein
MNRMISSILSLLALTSLTLGLTNCSNDDSKSFEIISLYSGNIDLLNTVPAVDVDPDSPFEATFSIEVDPNSLSASVITLTKESDGARPGLAITGSGKDVMIQPNGSLDLNTSYTLKFSGGIKAVDGQALAPIERQFTTISNLTQQAK